MNFAEKNMGKIFESFLRTFDILITDLEILRTAIKKESHRVDVLEEHIENLKKEVLDTIDTIGV